MNAIADNKTVKFGEPSMRQYRAKPFVKESVETGRQIKKVCLYCNKSLGKYKSKFCSSACKNNNRSKTKIRKTNCITCGDAIVGRYRNSKYCSITCRSRYLSYKYRVAKGLIKQPGIGSGNAQKSGNLHHTYKNGRRNFRKVALKHYGEQCVNCGATNIKIDIHHIDMDVNQQNNEISNLIPLCRSCHKRIHSGSISLKVQSDPQSDLR